MKHEFRKNLNDEVGDGEMKVKQSIIDKQRRKEEKMIRKAKKKLMERAKSKNYKGERANIDEQKSEG
jgi:hypothetical protein